MFCYQCEQAMGCNACTKKGVCGKEATTSEAQDRLTNGLINLAVTLKGKSPKNHLDRLVIDGYFTTVTNVSFDDKAINALADKIFEENKKLGGNENFTVKEIFKKGDDIASLKSTLLLGLRGMAAYVYHALMLGYEDAEVTDWLYSGLYEITLDKTADELLGLIMDFGIINYKCMELLNNANVETYGKPEPTTVTMKVEKGPFIVISGHDLHDLKQLLDQTEGKGVNVYTHGEMLPCHSYPELKKYENLKGNFGTAWQNQRKEFDGVPAAFLFTTNCIMQPKESYFDRVFTTATVGYPGLVNIPEVNGKKDFSKVIEKAIELGGYSENKIFTGINGGSVLTTGFGVDTVLSVADKVIDAVKAGAIKHFLLVGGCDGAKPGRNYYTDMVKDSPDDTVILTLACGKYRFNDLDLGTIGGLPRIMDMGQCNDAYSAIRVAIALSEAFECGINELPLTLVLSWYEQKAICVLLSLLALGVKNIYVGPTLPAFMTENVLNILVEKFDLHPITTAEADLKTILG
ncbi:MAG: hydroxylamine reductase [Lachnospirales bacterium]